MSTSNSASATLLPSPLLSCVGSLKPAPIFALFASLSTPPRGATRHTGTHGHVRPVPQPTEGAASCAGRRPDRLHHRPRRARTDARVHPPQEERRALALLDLLDRVGDQGPGVLDDRGDGEAGAT